MRRVVVDTPKRMRNRPLAIFLSWGPLAIASALALSVLAVDHPTPAQASKKSKKCKAKKKNARKGCKRSPGSGVVFDVTPPADPVLNATVPGSPANNDSPRVLGGAEPGSAVRLYADPSCTVLVGSGSAEELSTAGMIAAVPRDKTTALHSIATDASGNTSGCSSPPLVYVEDSSAPAAPSLSTTSPGSPGSGTSPKVLGSAEASSTVRLYTDSGCSNLTATASAAQLASPGITVNAAANSTTSFYATATDAVGHTSGCSSPGLDYVEAPVQVQAAPDLYPGFDPDVSDYVTRCNGTDPVAVSVDAPHGSSVSVDGSWPADGTYSVPITLQSGQEFAFEVTAATYSKTFYVRCLPSDFTTWTFDRLGEPNNDFYLAEPSIGFSDLSDPSLRYTVVWDDRGVPIWWFQPDDLPMDSKVLSDGTIAYGKLFSPDPYEIRGLDGTLVGTAGIVGGNTDSHDLQELPNGNRLLLEYRERTGADQTACTGSADTSVIDAVIQEVDPSGNLVWEWNSKDHVAPEETGRWCSMILGPPYDIAHINSVEPDGDSLIISLRHTDSIYKIDRPTGVVIWKLGGTTTPQSLTVVNDPYGAYPFGGQHDARLQADGTVALHDNATSLTGPAAHAPRAVRYSIDEDAMTATLVESVTDPMATSSFCCGSARRSPSGAWVMSWGANNLVTEFGADGDRTFRLSFPNAFSYRAFPVPPGLLTRSALRTGMDAQFPRP